MYKSHATACSSRHYRHQYPWWPTDTSDGNAVETAFRVYFDLSYTLNTHENRITKPLMAFFCCKVTELFGTRRFLS